MGVEVLDFLPQLVVMSVWISIGGANGSSIGGSWDMWHIFRIRILFRKIASAIRIMVASEVNILCAASVTGLSSFSKRALASNSLLYFVFKSWIALRIVYIFLCQIGLSVLWPNPWSSSWSHYFRLVSWDDTVIHGADVASRIDRDSQFCPIFIVN